MNTVLPSSGIRIVNVEDRLFCCGLGYFDSNGTCSNSTRGSDAPFPVDQGYVIFNRSSGSTSPNSTATVTSTVTLAGHTIISAATLAATGAGTAASPPPTSDREPTVVVAVGVPLGIALLGCVGMLWRQKREANGLRKEKTAWEEKYVALLESKTETQRSENVPHGSSARLMRHQLEDAAIGEMAG